jgi:hypothetical protein
MKNHLFAAALLSCSVNALADNHEKGTWVAAEYHFCHFNEGQGHDDLMNVVGKFNKFLEKHREAGSYDAIKLVEAYDVDSDYDYVWIGHWPSMKDMANATQNWMDNGQELNAEFAAVSRCDAVKGFQYIYLASPPDSDPWPINYRYCTLKEGKTNRQVREFADTMAEVMVADGAKGGGRFFYLSHGSVKELPYDFVWASSPGSFANQYHNWELRQKNGWWQQFREEYRSLMECSTDVQYLATYMTKPLKDQ